MGINVIKKGDDVIKKRFREDEIISGVAILERWSWVPEEYLIATIDSNEIMPYYVTERATSSDGSLFYICFGGVYLTEGSTVNKFSYDFKKTVFEVCQVEAIEKKCPELTCAIEYVAGDDFDKIKRPQPTFSVLDSTLDNAGVARLERGKIVKTAEMWGRYLESSVRLTAYVIEKCNAGHEPFTKGELDEACRELQISTLTEAAMRIFRRSVPEKYINFGGRPPKS